MFSCSKGNFLSSGTISQEKLLKYIKEKNFEIFEDKNDKFGLKQPTKIESIEFEPKLGSEILNMGILAKKYIDLSHVHHERIE